MNNAYVKTPTEVLDSFGVHELGGLSDGQVKDLRSKHGPNGMRNDIYEEMKLSLTFA